MGRNVLSSYATLVVLNAQMCLLCTATGFRESQLPRQGKQPPEAALTLESSEATAQAITHALTLLQSPLAAGQTHSQDKASTASGVQGKQAELVQSQQLKQPLDADSSNVLSPNQALQSISALQQSQSTSAQSGSNDLATARSEQQLASDASDGGVVLPTSADVQVTTNVSAPTVQMRDVTGVEEAGGSAASEARSADAESQRMPETPMMNLTAGDYEHCPVL